MILLIIQPVGLMNSALLILFKTTKEFKILSSFLCRKFHMSIEVGCGRYCAVTVNGDGFYQQ